MIAPARLPFPEAVFVTAIVLFLVFGVGPNLPLAALALIVLLSCNLLLWRPGESPILLLVFGYQWLQASISIFHANTIGVNVGELSSVGGRVSVAAFLSLAGLLVLAAGMRIGAGQRRRWVAILCYDMAVAADLKLLFRVYILASLAATTALIIARYLPPLGPPLLAVTSLKWASFWILAFTTFSKPRPSWGYFFVAFLFECSMGFGGYFADFRTVFFVTILALGASGFASQSRRLASLIAISALLVSASIVWTAVKTEYRRLISGGEQAQIITVDYSERLTGLVHLVGQLESHDLVTAIEDTARRISYIDYFAVVLERVPDEIPYQYGSLWLDAMARPFMPRVLFPNKTTIDDSERTNYFTGLNVAGQDAATSISIGYIGESYIDFGAIAMMAIIFLYGFFLGRIYQRYVSGRRTSGLLGMGLASSVLLVASPLEASVTKVMGGLIVNLLVAYLTARYIVPPYFPWLLARR